MGSLTEIFRDKQEWGWAGRPDRRPAVEVPSPEPDELFFPWPTDFAAPSADQDTGTVREQSADSYEVNYLQQVLGNDLDIENERDAAKERQRNEREMFLSAVEGAKRI